MDIKELRIGNIVKIDDEHLGPIEGKVTSLKESGEAELLLSVSKGNGRYFVCGSDDIFPVPITDELLLKIGFRKNSFGWWRLDKRNDKFMIKGYSQITTIEYWNEVHNPEDVTETNYGSTIEFPYKIHLHTFQNIWYLLTGKELEIKL